MKDKVSVLAELMGLCDDASGISDEDPAWAVSGEDFQLNLEG